MILLRSIPHCVAFGMCFLATEFRCNRLRRLCAAPPNLDGGFQNFACIGACDSTALGSLHNPIAPNSSADCPILFSQLFSTSGRSYHSIVALFTTQHTILAILRPSSSTAWLLVFFFVSSPTDLRLLTCCPLVPCFETNLSATRPRASRLSCSAYSLR